MSSTPTFMCQISGVPLSHVAFLFLPFKKRSEVRVMLPCMLSCLTSEALSSPLIDLSMGDGCCQADSAHQENVLQQSDEDGDRLVRLHFHRGAQHSHVRVS